MSKDICTVLGSRYNRLLRQEEFYNSVSCLFVEGTEFMKKTEIYEAIKKDWEKCAEAIRRGE